MRPTSIVLIASLAMLGSEVASAQPIASDGTSRSGGAAIQSQPNTTGNDRDVVVPRGATGAETVTTDSAAGGNANLPERAVPNGSAGGGSGSR
jgi:hypothetical protein